MSEDRTKYFRQYYRRNRKKWKHYGNHAAVNRAYRIAHRDRCCAASRLKRMKQRVELLSIIGARCSNPKCPDPSQVPDIEHIADTGYWSGEAHRARVGTGGIWYDLLKLHKRGKDIRKIVQPLCHPCNLSKYFRFKRSMCGSSKPLQESHVKETEAD